MVGLETFGASLPQQAAQLITHGVLCCKKPARSRAGREWGVGGLARQDVKMKRKKGKPVEGNENEEEGRVRRGRRELKQACCAIQAEYCTTHRLPPASIATTRAHSMSSTALQLVSERRVFRGKKGGVSIACFCDLKTLQSSACSVVRTK